MNGRGAAAAASVVLAAALTAQVAAFIVSHSNTFDEPAVIGAGYAYARTGRIELETRVHPPLMKYLFGAFVSLASPSFDERSPALRANQPYAFGLDFLFRNRVPPERLLSLARLPSLLLSLALAIALWRWAVRWFGPWGGALSLAAYATEPNLLAHSGLANMDLGMTAFLFMAYAVLERHLETPTPRRLLLSGALAGCAVAAKIPGVFFFAWSGALAWARTRRLSDAVRLNAALALTAGTVLIVLYQVRYAPLLGGLIAQMAPAALVSGHVTEQHHNFLLGQTKPGGWPHYYLVALAVKTTLPFLALVLLGFWKGLDRRQRLVLGIPTLSYILLCSLASKQNGLRYILPVFPFLCLAVGGLARVKERRLRLAVGVLLAWAATETALIAPNYLAYFNQLAGGPAGGHRVLVDSNLDWGQDFPRIREALRDGGDPQTVIACLGNGDRDHYFGPHEDLLAWESERPDPRLYSHVNSSAPAREWLIVSASFLQGFGLSDPQAFSWLRERRALAQPGYSTFIYDISADGLSHFNIGKIFASAGRRALARRHFERASALEPAQPLPQLALGDALRADGDARGAAAAYARALRRANAPAHASLRDTLRERLRSAPARD